jgi:hypothetical protein
VWFHKTSCSPKGRKIDPSFDYDSFCAGIGGSQEDDLSAKAEQQIDAIFNAMVVPGSTEPSYPYEAQYNRIKDILAALQVYGTQTAGETIEILFARIRNLEKFAADLAAKEEIAFTPVDTSQYAGSK